MHDAPQCRNCGTAAPLKYCANCGQETRLHVPSAREFIHEFVTHYIAIEGKLWRTLKLMLFKPGCLTTEYLAGRRASLSSCTISDFRFAGSLSGGEAGDVIELVCDGGAGFIAVLSRDRSTFTQSQTCATSAERGGARCEL